MNLISLKKGSAALTTVILVSGILFSAGLGLILLSMDLALTSKGFNLKTRTEFNTLSCLEESLRLIKNNESFVGTISPNNPVGSCTANITIDSVNPNYRVVQVTSSIQNYTFSKTEKVDISTDPITLVK